MKARVKFTIGISVVLVIAMIFVVFLVTRNDGPYDNDIIADYPISEK